MKIKFPIFWPEFIYFDQKAQIFHFFSLSWIWKKWTVVYIDSIKYWWILKIVYSIVYPNYSMSYDFLWLLNSFQQSKCNLAFLNVLKELLWNNRFEFSLVQDLAHLHSIGKKKIPWRTSPSICIDNTSTFQLMKKIIFFPILNVLAHILIHLICVSDFIFLYVTFRIWSQFNFVARFFIFIFILCVTVPQFLSLSLSEVYFQIYILWFVLCKIDK